MTLYLTAWLVTAAFRSATDRLFGGRQRRQAEEARVFEGFDLLREVPEVDVTEDAAPPEVAMLERRLELDIDTAYHAQAEQWLADIKTCVAIEFAHYTELRDMCAWDGDLPLGFQPRRVPGATLDRELVAA
jgi:hypothetical protein